MLTESAKAELKVVIDDAVNAAIVNSEIFANSLKIPLNNAIVENAQRKMEFITFCPQSRPVFENAAGKVINNIVYT